MVVGAHCAWDARRVAARRAHVRLHLAGLAVAAGDASGVHIAIMIISVLSDLYSVGVDERREKPRTKKFTAI